MATKSIYKNIQISDNNAGRSLADALEKSQKAAQNTNRTNRTPQRVAKANIKTFLGKTKK